MTFWLTTCWRSHPRAQLQRQRAGSSADPADRLGRSDVHRQQRGAADHQPQVPDRCSL